MSKKDKLLESIKNNPHDVSFQDIKKLLEERGFSCRQPNKGSSHFIFTKAGSEPISIPSKRPIKAVYVKKVLKLIGEA
ncbi:MAG: type II toxin-antitoxin system HicA family toxin [Campylobacterales bacterium]